MNYWYLLGIISALCLTGQDLVRKKMLKHGHVQQYTATRYLVLASLGFFVVPFMSTRPSFELLFVIWLVALFSGFGIIYIARAFRHLDISVVAPLTNLTPAFLLLFAFMFLGESPSTAHIAGIALLIVGAYLLELRPHKHNNLEPLKQMIKSKYMHILLLAVMVFAMLAVFEKYLISNHTDALSYFFYYFWFASLNFLFLQWYRYGLREVKEELKKDLKGYVIGGVFSVAAALSYMLALAHVPVTAMVPLRRTNTLFVTFLGGRMFKESNSRTKALACAIMILGATLILTG